MEHNCDWPEHKMHILETLKDIREAIMDLHAEVSIIHLETKNGKHWQPWKYVLLGAIITLPSQIVLEAVKSFLAP